MLLISFGPWAFRRLTSFVKSQVDEATKKHPAVMYQQLGTTEDAPDRQPEIAGDASEDSPPPPPLDFDQFEQLERRPPSCSSRIAKAWRRFRRSCRC